MTSTLLRDLRRCIALLLLLLTSFAPRLSGQADSAPPLQAGAHVRVKVPKLSVEWISGTVVTMQRTATCLAIRLDHTTAAGQTQYAFFTSVKALEVDRRTNQGVLVVGLPAPGPGDWDPWTPEMISAIARRCQR